MLDWKVLKTSRINFSFELVKKIGTKKSVLIESVISLRKKCGDNSDTFKNILNNDSTQASKFLSIFFHIYDNIAHIKHKDSFFSKDNLEIHIASKNSFEMNALKCVENNSFCMFNSRRAIPFIHILQSMFLTESSKHQFTVSASPFFLLFSHL